MNKELAKIRLIGLLSICIVGLSSATILAEDEATDDASAKYKWEFTGTDKGKWSASNGLKNFKVVDGALVAEVSKIDPYSMNYGTASMKIDVWDVPLLKVRMKHSVFNQFKIYFSTKESANLDEEKIALIPVTPDGEWHEYVIEMDANPKWDGILKDLRFDPEPGDCIGATFTIDYIRLCDR